MKHMLRLTTTLASLVLLLGLTATVRAQSLLETRVSFEQDCVGAATPGNFDVFGYKQVSSGLYASCGVASITSGGTVGAQQLHNPPVTNLSGQEGDVVLAGAFSANGGLSFGDVVMIFSPTVNELSFKVLDLNNASGLTISLQAAGGATIPVTQPTVSGGTAAFSQKSTTPIQRVTISYTPNGFLDGWFVDSLVFNTWRCGDGEAEGAPANEACDDGDDDFCDGCGNDCTVTIDGCFDNGTCIADGVDRPGSFGCAQCDLGLPPPGNDDDWSNKLTGNICDDGLFCVAGETCNGAGACVGTQKDCNDNAICSVDSCSETTNQCDNTLAVGCLINGACVSEGQLKAGNKCLLCSSTDSKTDWSPVPAGQTCGEPSCSAGVLTPAPRCDGTDQCETQATRTCDGAICADSVSCTGTCQTDDECLRVNHCEDGKCVPDRDPGDGCGRPGECASGFCADGVCCDQACDRLCEACNVQGSVGMCTGFAAGSDPEMECPDGQLCASAGLCAPEDRPIGTECSKDIVCESGHCTDGVCCDSVCNGGCEACNIEGELGSCTYHTAGTNPEDYCTGEGVCGSAGECVTYETRGNGLCSLDAAHKTSTFVLGLLSLVSLVVYSRRRRRA